MDINRLKEYIVIVNQGSGCIIQPQGDKDHTYVLTAKHVVEQTPDKIQVTRFELVNGNKWSEIDIEIDKLVPEDNYFPHPDLDIAIIKLSKLNNLDEITGLESLTNNRRGYILAGYPRSRREGEKVQWYRTDENTTIKELRDGGLQGARVPNNPGIEEVKGQSGGAIVKLEAGNGLLAGIQIKMIDGDEQLGAVEFMPFSAYQGLVSLFKGKLSPISSISIGPSGLRRSMGLAGSKRKYVSINIDDLTEDEALISDLVELIREDSERVILEEKKQKVLINECNEELFRITDILPINSITRVKFRERIGTVLFKILQKHDPNSVKKIVKERESEALGIFLHFTENAPGDQQEIDFSNSCIPWEYLHYPGNIVPNDFPYPIAEKMVITRQLEEDVLEDPNDHLQELTELKVLYVTKDDFKLLDESTKDPDDEIRMSMAVSQLRIELKQELDQLQNALTIDFTVQSVNKPGSDVLNSREIGKLITTTNPNSNIIHIVADLHDPNDQLEHKLITAINRAVAQEDKNKLSLIIIQQSIRDHRKGQYRNYDKMANDLLRKTKGLSAVMTIPFKLGPGSNSFMIPGFYRNLAKGMNLSEAYFKLSKVMLDKECIALPILYLKGGDFSFIMSTSSEAAGRRFDSQGANYGQAPLGVG